MSEYRPPRALVWSVLALLALQALLGLTVFLAYRPLGSLNTSFALTIASTKALIVATVFMELLRQSPLVIAFAGAGLFWLGILLWLSSMDFLTRPALVPT